MVIPKINLKVIQGGFSFNSLYLYVVTVLGIAAPDPQIDVSSYVTESLWIRFVAQTLAWRFSNAPQLTNQEH